ncbi:hypothetical protein [Cystobacter fuscus]|uniref:hypothetical protein n=1 Tax=Cystobacter fuscus TaxID=43 RepID=UPI002B2AD3C8|nr:hypothetical protein F0U63_48630 [Cystobacter fuscus]
MPLSREQLVSIAKSYWSSNGDPRSRQELSPEAERLHARWEQELLKITQWWAFLEGLEMELPGFSIGDATATPDACFRCVAYPTGTPLPALRWVVVGCVSILAPVYTVYGVRFEYGETTRALREVEFDPHRPEIRAPAEVIARRLEAVFGFSTLPREVAETPVPLFVQWKQPPETTLFHALFTNEPGSLP